jgi:hypothetical protein
MPSEKNNGFGREKYPNQVNVKLTDLDIKEVKAVNDKYFGGDASMSMLIRVLVRKGFEWFAKEKK